MALSLTYTGDEVVRTGLTIFPFIGVGFAIMTVFSIITIYYSSSRLDQWSVHKVSEAILGCVCPLLATSSALGALFWFGFRFGTILCVTPFLILAIGKTQNLDSEFISELQVLTMPISRSTLA